MTGRPRSVAVSMLRVILSPATEPRVPPMNAKSNTLIATSLPSIRPKPVTAESLRPLFFWCSAMLSL